MLEFVVLPNEQALNFTPTRVDPFTPIIRFIALVKKKVMLNIYKILLIAFFYQPINLIAGANAH